MVDDAECCANLRKASLSLRFYNLFSSHISFFLFNAGICALALQANPKLSWRDMQHIVVQTANPEPLLKEDGWFTNGVGRKFNHKFGYGLMDASAMVDLAQNWPGIASQRECSSPLMTPSLNLAKAKNEVTKVAVTMDGCKDSINAVKVLEHVVCKITLRHNPRGSLHVVLISPVGTRSSLLLPRPRDRTDSGFENWPFLSVHFWGESPNGTWTLEVSQNEGNVGRKPGILKTWQLIMYGTDEYSPMGPQFPKDDDIENEEGEDEDEEEEGSFDSGRKNESFMHENGNVEVVPGSPISEETNNVAASEDGCHPECVNGCTKLASSDSCHSCRNYNFMGNCVPACPDGSYETPENTCELCSKKCSKCHGPLESQCLSCPSGKLLMPSTASCLKKCPRGWRAASNTCLACPTNCANCNNEDRCENCLMGFYLRTDTQECVASCPDGQFKDNRTMTCQFCDADCDTCFGPRPTQCARCKKGSHYFHRKCSKEACPTGYFADLNISECVPCPKGCQTCLGPDSCDVCEKGWSLINGKYCIPSLSAKCPQEGMYFNNRTGTCSSCHPNCGTCFDGTPEGCLSCNHQIGSVAHDKGHTRLSLMHISSCLEEACPEQTFQFNHECRHCAHACKICSSLQKCDVCHLGYFLTKTGHCVPSCPLGQFGSVEGNNTCQDCPRTCLECVNATTCSVCEDKTPFLTLEGNCVDRCPFGTYKNGEDHRCLNCHASCHSCSGAGSSDCLSCPPGTRLHDYSCQSCSLGRYYDTATSNCQKCHQSCQTCSGPLQSECLSCPSPNLHLDENKTCVPCCSSNIATEPAAFATNVIQGPSNEGNDGEVENTVIEQTSTCCLCDEKTGKCLPREHLNGNKKRGTRELVSTNYLDAFVVFMTMLLVTSLAIVGYRKYKWSRRRIIRAKWRRVHQYEKVPTNSNSNHGCEDDLDLMQSNNGSTSFNPADDFSDSEEDGDEVDISMHRFGDERRRLLMHNGNASESINT